MIDADQRVDETVEYLLHLDRLTLDALREMARQHRCGIGGELRHVMQNAIEAFRRAGKSVSVNGYVGPGRG